MLGLPHHNREYIVCGHADISEQPINIHRVIYTAITWVAVNLEPHEADIDPVSRPLPQRYGGQRFTAPPLDIEESQGFSITKPPLARNTSLSFYEAENRMKEMATKADSSRSISRK